MGIYLYGLSRSDGLVDFERPGLAEIGPAHTLDLDGLTAVISLVPEGVIEAALGREPQDPEWIVPRALHHERVVEEVLALTPVLPVRFGCIFGSEDRLRESIARHRERVVAFLGAMAGRAEWSLKAHLDLESAVGSLLESEPDLAARFRSLPAAPGTRYFLEKRLREEARARAVRAAKATAAKVEHAVGALGIDARSLPIREADSEARILLLKLALLAPPDQLDLVEQAAAAACRAPGCVPLAFERSGPWPPYHFCPSLGESSS